MRRVQHVRGRFLSPHPSAVIALTAALCYALTCIAHGNSVAQFTVLNDFWGNAFAADHWEWNARRMWNGFFPPGYPFLLTILPGQRMLTSAYTFNVLAGTVLLLAVWRFMQHAGATWTGVLAMSLVALHPLLLAQVLTTGPDAAFVTLAVVGALLIFGATVLPQPSLRAAVIGGMALAAAGWLRYHAFPFSAAVFVAAAVVGGRARVRLVAFAALPVLLAGVALLCLGWAAGDPWAVLRDQAFNTYTRLIQGPNWFQLPPASAFPSTVGEAIARDPAAFRRNYVAFSAPHLWLVLPPVAALILGSRVARLFGLYALIVSALFVPVVNLGASPRGVACVVPLVLIAGAWAIGDSLGRVRSEVFRHAWATVAVSCLIAFVWTQWKPETSAYLEAVRYRHRVSTTLEAILRADRVKIAMQVFSTTDLYFLGATGWRVASYHPRVVGGWPTIDLPGYNESYPPHRCVHWMNS